MKQLNAQAMEKALNNVVKNLGIDCLKDSKRFHSAVADLLPGFEYEAERKALCACICSEVSEKIINEKQHVSKNCVRYLIKQSQLTELQANELVRMFMLILWRNDNYGSMINSSTFSGNETKTTKIVDNIRISTGGSDTEKIPTGYWDGTSQYNFYVFIITILPCYFILEIFSFLKFGSFIEQLLHKNFDIILLSTMVFYAILNLCIFLIATNIYKKGYAFSNVRTNRLAAVDAICLSSFFCFLLFILMVFIFICI